MQAVGDADVDHDPQRLPCGDFRFFGSCFFCRLFFGWCSVYLDRHYAMSRVSVPFGSFGMISNEFADCFAIVEQVVWHSVVGAVGLDADAMWHPFDFVADP